MIRSAEILDLIGKSRWDGGVRGVLIFMQQDLRRNPRNTQARRQYVEQALQIAKAAMPTYVHPAETQTARAFQRHDNGDLTPAELMWLQRLPLDPAQVTHDDAARLAGLARSIDGMAYPNSRHLVESIWRPVRELHDIRLAEQQVRLTREALPPVPAAATQAVAEALDEEHPEWRTTLDRQDELGMVASTQAAELVAERLERRERDHERAVQSADARLETLRAEAADRLALTRSTA